MQKVQNRDYYTYRCKYCGYECRKKLITGSSVPLTKRGDYGDSATPQPTTYADEMYEATTISFNSTPYIEDSANLFGKKHFTGGMTIRIATGSGTNDGDYTISDRGVTRGKILVDESLTDENAATAGTVTISNVQYKPSVTTGCPMCGSLNSK